MVESLNPTDFAGYLVGSLETALGIIAAVDSDNVFLQYDLYHCQMMRGQLAATMRDIKATLQTYLPSEHVFVIDDADVGEASRKLSKRGGH